MWSTKKCKTHTNFISQINFKKVNYDIEAEQAKFSDKVNEFYKTRLERGI